MFSDEMGDVRHGGGFCSIGNKGIGADTQSRCLVEGDGKAVVVPFAGNEIKPGIGNLFISQARQLDPIGN
jgi:hypothetical protein